MLRSAALALFFIATAYAGYKHRGTFGRRDIHRTVVAIFNQGGVTGEVVFTQERRNAPVDIQVNLVGLDQFSDAYRWSINEHPIRRSLLSNYPCSEVGNVFNLDNPGTNPPSCVGNPEGCAAGDLTGKLGRLRNDLSTQIFQDPNLDLFGSESIAGRSLLIDRQDGPSGAFICANIELNGRPSRRVETFRAFFSNGIIQGDVIIRDPDGFDEVTIEADLYTANGTMLNNAGNISWSLNFGPADENCAGVGQVYGSALYNPAAFSCSREKQRQCIIGDLSSKCGRLNFIEGRARAYCSDGQLGTLSAGSLEQLTLRIADSDGNSLGCSNFSKVRPLRADAKFRAATGEFGEFVLHQDSPDDETYLRAFVTGLRSQSADYRLRIFNNAVPPSGMCNATVLGGMYTVQGRALFTSSSGMLTADACVIGNLDNYLPIDGVASTQSNTDTSIPLFGPFSVIDRSIGLVDNTGTIIACSNITNSCSTCTLDRFNSILGYQDLNNPSQN